MPVAGVVSDGQHSVRLAVGQALPGVPHQLCHFHYLREAALPIFEADRHAKKELKKRVRGVRPIERAVEGRDDPEAEAVRGYCAAVRWALTDDGRPPLAASGLRLHRAAGGGRRQPGRVEEKGGLGRPLRRIAALVGRGLARTAALWPDVRRACRRLRAAASILADRAGLDAPGVRARYERLLAAWAERRGEAGTLAEAVDRFMRVHRQLPARPVPPLPGRGPAAHRQRAGAAVRGAPPPRAPRHRPQGGLARAGAARRRPARRRRGHASAPGLRA